MPESEQKVAEEEKETALIEAARNGDHRAFGGLVERYQNRLFRFVLERTGNREDAEDILQLTFVSAYRNLAGYRREYRFSTWLFTLAYRRTVDRLRKRRDLPAEAVPESVCNNHPADSLESAESRERLWGLARRVLDDRQHALLWLRYGEDLDLSEIASVTGLSQTHVKVLLYRARKNLARHLATFNEERKLSHLRSPGNENESAWLRHPMMEKP